jgi:hypothetical protein
MGLTNGREGCRGGRGVDACGHGWRVAIPCPSRCGVCARKRTSTFTPSPLLPHPPGIQVLAGPTRARLQFEGCYMNCSLWLNGFYLGNHPYGYTEFEYDITRHLVRSGGCKGGGGGGEGGDWRGRGGGGEAMGGGGGASERFAPSRARELAFAETQIDVAADAYVKSNAPPSGIQPSPLNRLEVRVESRGDNSRWYAGAGLFRPVKMRLHPPVHAVGVGGVHVTTPRVELLDEEGKEAAATGELTGCVWEEGGLEGDGGRRACDHARGGDAGSTREGGGGCR